MPVNKMHENKRHIPVIVVLSILARRTVTCFRFHTGKTTAVDRSMEMTRYITHPLLITKHTRKSWNNFAVFIPSGDRCWLCKMLSMPINGRTMSAVKTQILAIPRLKTFVGLLNCRCGSLLATQSIKLFVTVAIGERHK